MPRRRRGGFGRRGSRGTEGGRSSGGGSWFGGKKSTGKAGGSTSKQESGTRTNPSSNQRKTDNSNTRQSTSSGAGQQKRQYGSQTSQTKTRSGSQQQSKQSNFQRPNVANSSGQPSTARSLMGSVVSGMAFGAGMGMGHRAVDAVMGDRGSNNAQSQESKGDFKESKYDSEAPTSSHLGYASDNSDFDEDLGYHNGKQILNQAKFLMLFNEKCGPSVQAFQACLGKNPSKIGTCQLNYGDVTSCQSDFNSRYVLNTELGKI